MKRRTFGLAACAGALLALLSAVSGDAQAQSAVITGKVTGRGSEALGGATVVVVTGTAGGTEIKKVPFAISQVDRSQLQEAPAVSALGSLEGKVAGVRLIDASGAPGGEPIIRLRSATALTSMSGPLIIVDGTITRHGLADINSQDIDRVELVKGAAASSLYGSDAANGVIQ